jgi:UDP-GlcNAc3NAcA epimerase
VGSARQTVLTVVGARPHFVKAFPLLRAMRHSAVRHVVVHTGQHYSAGLSEVFFQDLQLPEPDHRLEVGSGTHAEQTSRVLLGVERIILETKPSSVVVFGDTNSTLGAALAAAKYYYPVVHIEAGVRCGRRHMPEEINRTLIDRISDVLVVPSELAVRNLEAEGIRKGVINLGDFMYDTFLAVRAAVGDDTSTLERFGLSPGGYFLSTIHREATTQDPDTLARLLATLGGLGTPTILPMHPRTQARLRDAGRWSDRIGDLRIVEPQGYADMMRLLLHSAKVFTDSGGLQKEAFWAGVPCVTLMDETTWPETIDAGWNVMTGTRTDEIVAAAAAPRPVGARPEVYGPPGAADRLVAVMGW